MDVGSGVVEQGGTLPVGVTGLEPGQRIGATLYSDPIIVTGIPAADASGRSSFAVRVPAGLPVGAHTLVVTSPGFPDIRVAVTVVPSGGLAVTGAQLPWALALLGAVLLVAGVALSRIRRGGQGQASRA